MATGRRQRDPAADDHGVAVTVGMRVDGTQVVLTVRMRPADLHAMAARLRRAALVDPGLRPFASAWNDAQSRYLKGRLWRDGDADPS